MNKLDCWWISKNFEQKKEIVCESTRDCVHCPIIAECEKYERHQNIPAEALDIKEVFKDA